MKISNLRRLSPALVLFLLRAAVAAVGSVPCQDTDPKHALSGLQPFITAEMEKAKLPGMAMAIVQNKKLLCAEGFGLRDVEHKLPVSPQTLFAIGSTSKSFTALAMGILNDEGKLDWDKPVRQYLPEFQMYDPVASERMTPRDLITHRAGFARHDLVWYSSDFNREDLVRRLRYLQTDSDFRSGYRYNNLLVATAGYLVGKISGSTWEEFVRARVLLPLKMSGTNFSIADSQRCSDFSYPYEKDEKSGAIKQIPFHSADGIGPAGSINSNVEDISKYLIFQLGKGTVAQQRIVSEANLNLMHTPQTAMPSSSPFRELGQYSYGMGWVVTAYRGHRYIWHNGGIDGFYSLIAMLPDDDLGVVVLTNVLGNHQIPEILAYNVFDRLLGLAPIDWSARFQQQREKNKQAADQAKSKNSSNRQSGTHPSRDLKDYVGRYQNAGYGIIEILPAGQDFTLKLNKISVPLRHFHYDLFQVPEDSDSFLAGMKFQFALDLDGGVNRITAPLQTGVEAIEFVRIPDKVDRGILQSMAGEYELGSAPISVTLTGEQLQLVLPGQPGHPLVFTRGLKFNIEGLGGYSVEFKKDPEGYVSELVFYQPDGTFVAKRK